MRKIQTFLLICLALLSTLSAYPQEDELLNLLPETINGSWTLQPNYEYYQGDDLFFLINGGAELYFEYGFNDVISANYMDEQGRNIKVELYRMSSDSAAYGIYSIKRFKGETIDIAPRAKISGQHIMFSKGNIYGLLLADSELDHETFVGFASQITAQIERRGEPPALTGLLSGIDGINPEKIYLMGNIALGNLYNFHYQDIFRFEEAVYADYGEFGVYMLGYKNPQFMQMIFNEAVEKIMDNKKYSITEAYEDQLDFTDNRNIQFLMTQYQSYILIVRAQSTDPSAGLNKFMQMMQN